MRKLCGQELKVGTARFAALKTSGGYAAKRNVCPLSGRYGRDMPGSLAEIHFSVAGFHSLIFWVFLALRLAWDTLCPV